MPERLETQSRRLLRRLRDTLAEPGQGQERLDRIVKADRGLDADRCLLDLPVPRLRDAGALRDARAQARGGAQDPAEAGRGAGRPRGAHRKPLNTADAPAERGFRYMPETGEERFSSFLGVPIQRLGEQLGVLVVQSKDGAALFRRRDLRARSRRDGAGRDDRARRLCRRRCGAAPLHKNPVTIRGNSGQEGTAEGQVWLHEPRVVITNLVNDDPGRDRAAARRGQPAARLGRRVAARGDDGRQGIPRGARGLPDVRPFARLAEADGAFDRERALGRGGGREGTVRGALAAAGGPRPLSARPAARSRRLANRLLRILTGQGRETGAAMPERPILVARTIGPAELLDYGGGCAASCSRKARSAAMRRSWRGRWRSRWSSRPSGSRPRR
jgi:phosphotransferase system, enzyme I, PtsP